MNHFSPLSRDDDSKDREFRARVKIACLEQRHISQSATHDTNGCRALLCIWIHLDMEVEWFGYVIVRTTPES